MTLSKHAYLVIAHNEPVILQTTISILDDARNDFYIMVDKKSDINEFQNLNAKYSKIIFVNKRIDIKWGTVSQVRTELELMKECMKSSDADEYSLFHIISGVDLPLMSSDEIFKFDQLEPDKNFISFDNDDDNIQDAILKTKYFHFFPYLCRNKCLAIRAAAKLFNNASIQLQRFFKIERHFPFPIAKGTNWCSLRPNLVRYLIENEKMILTAFRYSIQVSQVQLADFRL